jgi:hypothetical protein
VPEHDVEGHRALDHTSGEVAEQHSFVAGVGSEQGEGAGDVESGASGEHADGLFDDDPIVQCGLELLGEVLAAAVSAFVQDADGGDVGQGLGDPQVLGGGAGQVWW